MEWLPLGIKIAVSALFFIWLLLELFSQNKRHVAYEGRNGEPTNIKSVVCAKITVLCNILICFSYLGFFTCDVWMLKIINLDSVFPALTWFVIATFTIYCKRKPAGENNRWPSVLSFWWILFSLYNSFSITIYVINHFKWAALPRSFPTARNSDFISFPFCIFLCFNAIVNSTGKSSPELKRPLLHGEEEEENVSRDAFANAGIWSRLTFRWLNPLFAKGRLQKLKLDHVPPVPESESAEKAFCLLQESLRKEKTEVSSLPNAIIQAIWRSLAINAVFAGINTLSSYLGPFLVANFVNFLSDKDDNSSHKNGYMLAFFLFFAKTVESLSQRQWYFGAQQIGVRVRAALMVALYQKSLWSKYSENTNGKIINLLNVDVERIGDFCWYIHGIWLLPVQVSLALILLYWNLGGAASVAAFLATILVMVCNTPLANRQKKLHSKIMEAKDSRIKATSETLKCMRILKLHSWETTYLDKILELRETERSWMKKYLYTCSAVAFLFWASPTLVSVATFGVCIIVKRPLNSGTVLSALATFRILQEPIYNLPELISMIAQTKVSLDRLQQFIRQENQQKLGMNYNPEVHDVAIEIEAGEYGWDPNLNKPTVKIGQRMNIMKGQKVAVCGSVGSGKSSFLCSILGEIPRMSGVGIRVFGSKAYVPQSTWIQTGTVRENVLFGKEMDKDFYEDVLEGCALNRDIELWNDRDMSVVGERGMNLSGGQKQRIQLARAIYCDSDVYLLDDPFSAVDAHTGAHLFKECLSRLLAHKTVIYVTHQLDLLDSSDIVLVMREGEIVQCGKYEDLIIDIDGELVRQMAAHNQSLSQVTPPQQQIYVTCEPHQTKQLELKEEKFNNDNIECRISERVNGDEKESRRVKWNVYLTFITTAFKGALVPITVLCQVLFQGFQMGSNYWIAWATEKEGRASKAKLMGVFVLMSAGSSIFVLGRALLLSMIALETAQRLFLGMITCIFRAPISFFDSTPASQILNRSSTDQSTVDTDIPYRLAGLAFALIQLFSIIFLLSYVAWQVFLLFLVILAISIWYQVYYIRTARELARMVGIQKAPILHHFSESIAGAVTIRCFNQEDHFFSKNLKFVDDYSRITFHNYATMEWLSVRVNLLFNLVFFLVLVMLVSLPRAVIDPSLAGLAATYGLNLNVIQAWVIWNFCNVENKMISVERILQYSSIESEAPLIIKNCRPEPKWPMNGTIELDNLHVRYNPSLPMVLNGVTCTFPGDKKIGVVGRTGSGKSTLIQALFRVIEPSEGRIIIDGVDITKIGLQDLRSRLSIIPQDPTLFQGTIRNNLDPLEQHSDWEIQQVLNKCQLGEIVGKLDAPVAEDGENWSIGQRQLVCLARVLLKKRQILVLDEATASVDIATDNVIQHTIREETHSCTVITVAHRIPTVSDNDLVLVLDEGKVLEFDSPSELLKDELSVFSRMVMEFLRRSRRDHQSQPT